MLSPNSESTRQRSISPPTLKRKRAPSQAPTSTLTHHHSSATPATVEAGAVLIKHHLAFYSTHLAAHIRTEHTLLLLAIPTWQALYTRNQHARGHHFVVHQHDHPVAGMHYDLRLQISADSSCSWAIRYGLPGDPNSVRLNRNATETRVHCLWNHLVESASLATGSLLIWDTGEYEVLSTTTSSSSSSSSSSPGVESENTTDAESESAQTPLSEPEKLALAFSRNKIRIRLHGSRLPKGYVLYLRRSRDAALKDRAPTQQRRRRRRRRKHSSHGSDIELDTHKGESHSDENEDERAMIRQNNAYPGATNSIGSIHQRTWFASMDREASGFQRIRRGGGQTVWERRSTMGQGEGQSIDDGRSPGFDPFIVRGGEHERSIVTGRLAAEVMRDEGVTGFVPRKGWRAVVE